LGAIVGGVLNQLPTCDRPFSGLKTERAGQSRKDNPMLDTLGNTPRRAVRQSRRRRRSYCFSVERRAAVAAFLVKEHGWTTKQAAGLFCINTRYVSLARRMSEADRRRLIRGTITLSQLANLANPRRQLTDAKIDRIVARIGPELIMAALDRATRPISTPMEVTNDDDGPAEWWTEMMSAPNGNGAHV
jgi:hypothetical protein